MKRKMIAMITSMLLIVSMLSTICLAATKEYSISDLNTVINLNSGLFVVTRSTTSADPALAILDVSIEQLHVMLETNNVYLEAFPEDMSFEIVLAGGEAAEDAKNFADLTDDEIINSLEHNENGKYSVETINGIKYLVSEVSSEEPNNSYYTYKYTTVDKNIATNLTLQAESKPSGEVMLYFKETVNSMTRKDLKPSITENPYFMELGSTILGMTVVIGGLALILFLLIRLDKKNRKTN